MKVQELKAKKAVILRRKGYSYPEIIKKLHIAKSTLSFWMNSRLSEEEQKQIKKVTYATGREKIISQNKKRSLVIKKREYSEQKKYARRINKVSKKNLFWIGLGLYLAEGAKNIRYRAVFYNSDPALNVLMMRFFREICQVKEDKISIQMVLHEHISEEKARKYWSIVLKLPEKNFFRASFAKSKASKGVRPINRLPYGTIQISASGKDIANKIKGWMLGIEKATTIPQM